MVAYSRVTPGIDVCILVITILEAIVPVMVVLAVDHQMLHLFTKPYKHLQV